MMMPIKISCVSLNFQKLDGRALDSLARAYLSNDSKTILEFKKEIGFPVEQFAIIEKCNAIILVFCYFEDLSNDFIRGRILSVWDKLSRGGIIDSIRHIRFFEDDNAVRYLGECAMGIHSVTLGDSQVLSQVCDALKKASTIQLENPTFSILVLWLKGLASEIKLRTNLLSGKTSLERIAAGIVGRKIKRERKISLVGFGRSGKLIAKILNRELGYQLKIANRSARALIEIKKENKISIVDFFDYEEIISSDCIVFAIGSNEETKKYIDKLFEIIKEANTKPKIMIDLANPPLVTNIQDVEIITIKDLSLEANKNLNKRISEISKAREIINKQCFNMIENLKKEMGRVILNKQSKEISCKLNNEKLNILKIRNDSYKVMRNFLDKRDFIEVTTPYIVGISTDPPKVDKGGTIDIIWQGGGKAFLRQSNQIYKQIIVASGLPKIYEIGPLWRAETMQSYRHLQESIGLDIELIRPKELKELYELSYSIILNVKKHVEKIYKIKNENIILPKVSAVPIITYIEAINILNSKGYSIALGEDLGLIGEAKLGQIIKREYNSDIFIVKNYPDTIKKFYTKKIGNGLTETFDIILAGWEVVSGAIRETNRVEIERAMRFSGIDVNNYGFYLSAIDGAIAHGGFCLGIDRLIAKLLDLEMVSEAVAFPRTFKNLIP